MGAYGLYFGAISVCALLKQRHRPSEGRPLRFAVLAAARNEEACIAGLVESIRRQDYPPELVDIYVIPNNCTDDTAGAALAAGAQIIPVPASVRSTGQALHEAFAQLLDAGFVDAFRHFYPDAAGAYTWWSYMYHARQNNAGWRIDYFIVSEALTPRLTDCRIHSDVLGSDHCPVELQLD